MSSYDEPAPGHRQAVSQLAESRGQVLAYIKQINAVAASEAGPHENLVPAAEQQTLRTEATAALSDYVLQLQVYRHETDRWAVSLGAITLPTRFPASKPGGGERYFELEGQPQIPIETLSDVLELAGLKVTYSAPRVGRNNTGKDTRKYIFALTRRQLRLMFSAADDVAADAGFLGEITEPDTTDTEGF